MRNSLDSTREDIDLAKKEKSQDRNKSIPQTNKKGVQDKRWLGGKSNPQGIVQ